MVHYKINVNFISHTPLQKYIILFKCFSLAENQFCTIFGIIYGIPNTLQRNIIILPLSLSPLAKISFERALPTYYVCPNERCDEC